MRSTGSRRRDRRESDLGGPIQEYLETNGYTVRSEVHGCDITALKDDALIVVELKKGFTTDLLLQATDRQKAADAVYVALPAEGDLSDRMRSGKRRRGIERLLKRLEIGLILVHFTDDAPPVVEVAFHPVPQPKPRRSAGTRRVILREIAGRSANYNTGGSSGKKIVTAYREQAVFIACCLNRFGPMTPCALRAVGAGQAAQNILFKNVYDWFERIDRGLYALRPRGRDEIATDYPELSAHFTRKLDSCAGASAAEDALAR